jgi:hypothetical protein
VESSLNNEIDNNKIVITESSGADWDDTNVLPI